MKKYNTVTVHSSLGDTFEALEDDWITHEILTFGLYGYDKKELQAFSQVFSLMPQRNICFDVGGNIGNHTAFFCRYFKHVYALEPNPAVYDLLAKNIASNKLAASAFNIGLSNQNGMLNFYISNQQNIGSSSFEEDFCFNKDRVDGTVSAAVERGDDFVATNNISNIDFIKLMWRGTKQKLLRACGAL